MRTWIRLFLLGTALAAGALEAQTGLAVVKPAGKEPTLTLGGLLQVQGEAGDRGDARFGNSADRFYLRRARLNATGKFLEEFDFRLEGDFAGTLANTTGLRAQMTDGYIDWNRYAAANVRVGQFKTPFGYEQLYSDPRLTTLERSLVNDRLTSGRQLGAQVGGDLLDKRLSYAVGAFNGNGTNNNFNDDEHFMVAARLSGVLWQGKLLGQSASAGLGIDALDSDDTNVAFSSEFGFDSTPATADRDNIFAGTRRGTGIDGQLTAGPFELMAEYLEMRFEPRNARPAAELTSNGWYVQGSAYVIPQRLQVVLKHETFDPDDERSADVVRAETVGANYYLKGHDLKLMADWVRFDGPGATCSQDKLLARLQVIF
jgi:phosphate-selective porin OprO/OprP